MSIPTSTAPADAMASASAHPDTGTWMHRLATELWPINRSLTGPGLRETLAILKRELPEIEVRSVPSGTACFDWVVPDEWSIHEAYVEREDGARVIDLKDHTLHVVGYSVPIDREMDLGELQQHLHSLPDQPDAIPYVTSYYVRRWGFCLTHAQRQALKPGRYRVVIRSELKAGALDYAEAVIPGDSAEEVLLSTYVCHPSMANNELSGPVVAVALGRWLKSRVDRRYTYRLLFIPETIGSIVYLSRHHAEMKRNVVAGYVITCIGDERVYSYLPSRRGDCLSDIVAKHVLGHLHPGFIQYSFLDRGSDERQYCSPGIDLPISSILRSKYGRYPEYHTSLDDLEFVTPAGLQGGFAVYQRALECIDGDRMITANVLCEPQLGKRGLYPTLSTKASHQATRAMMDLLAYADGTMSLLDIAITIGQPMWELIPIVERLSGVGLVTASALPPGWRSRRTGRTAE